MPVNYFLAVFYGRIVMRTSVLLTKGIPGAVKSLYRGILRRREVAGLRAAKATQSAPGVSFCLFTPEVVVSPLKNPPSRVHTYSKNRFLKRECVGRGGEVLLRGGGEKGETW